MPSGNIGYRLIMSATPSWLETTGAGQHRIRLIVPSDEQKSRRLARLFLFVIPAQAGIGTYRHPDEGRDPLCHRHNKSVTAWQWIPAFAGMTISLWVVRGCCRNFLSLSSQAR